MTTYRSSPRDYAVQMESDEEREALVINPNEHIVVQKVSSQVEISIDVKITHIIKKSREHNSPLDFVPLDSRVSSLLCIQD